MTGCTCDSKSCKCCCSAAACNCDCTSCNCGCGTCAQTAASLSPSPATFKQSLVQHPAPGFTAKAVLNNQIFDLSLSEYGKQGKWTILLFYPLDFTFVCPTELCSFSDAIDQFRQLGCEVVGVSVDSEYCHLAWSQRARSEGGLAPCRIPLLSDITKSISRQYGVLVRDGSVALRGLFIVDPKGNVRQSTVNDLPIGRSVEEALRLLQALQYVDKHGEVCPANWKPGGRSMKADPVGSKEYFASGSM